MLVVIVGVLVALAGWFLSAAGRDRDRFLCQVNLGVISGAKTSYELDNNVHLGAKVTLSDLAPGDQFFARMHCPSAPDDKQTLQQCYRINRIGIEPECLICPEEHFIHVRPPPMQAVGDDPKQLKYQTELQNVANCFYDAHAILQAEPLADLDMGSWIRAAEERQSGGLTGDFSRLHWVRPGPHRLIGLSGGQVVRSRLVRVEERDNPDGTSTVFLTYEFFAEGAVTRARTTIPLEIETTNE